MNKKIVISPNDIFFLSFEEVKKLHSLGNEWAKSALKSGKQTKFYPSQEELPRHCEELISLADSVDRLTTKELECRWTPWSPRYLVRRRFPDGGEELIEPNSEGWSVAYNPPKEVPPLSLEQENQRRINAIAP